MRKSVLKRIGAVVLAFVLAAAVCVPAMADDINEARASLADVKITQGYNVYDDIPYAVHNYTSDGDDVEIRYTAELAMTDIMAGYLQPRQANLMRARFNVHINVNNGEILEMTDPKSAVTFSSTFLKPVDTTGGTLTYADGVYSYTMPLTPYYESRVKSGTDFTITVPMELIVYFDGETAYGYSDFYNYADGTAKPGAPAVDGATKLMFVDFSVEDWMAPILLNMSVMNVKDGVRESVTANSATWQTISANGTIDGDFDYAVEPVNLKKIGSFVNADYYRHFAFGDDEEIKEWVSNEVVTKLIRRVPSTPDEPIPENLNIYDHFAYIIGYPEGEQYPVHPERNITRAEVATIFFRMLTDTARSQYWSKTNSFSDVADDAWYNNAVSTLTKMGILNGYPDGTFKPDASISRAEFAAIAVRFYNVERDPAVKNVFTDIDNTWAKDNIIMAYQLGLVNGYPDSTYRPDNAIVRAEAFTIVNNTLRRKPINEGLRPVSEMITWPDNADPNVWYYAAVQEATNSHDYTMGENGETWTKILPVRDWVQFERIWSDANSASNPGDVIGIDLEGLDNP